MNFLINCSNLKQGGGIQVADSVSRELYRFKQHHFTVVLSTYFSDTASVVKEYPNVDVYEYDIRNSVSTVLMGRDKYLDALVRDNRIDAVLTIFGPSRWEPRCPHLCGFAKAFHVIPESPYYQRMGTLEQLKNKFENKVYEFFFQRTTRHFYTENPFISSRLQKLFKRATIYTVTNNYNQVFDHPDMWKEKALPQFNGVTLLTVSNSYPHKNLEIAVAAARFLRSEHPDFLFRFVISINKEQMNANLDGVDDCFIFLGSVDISECPYLYKKADIAFQPTLLECFTATYPEAMRMGIPIVTTDLEFARGLCGNAACYYSPVNAQACADAIYKVSTDKDYAAQLVGEGKRQLMTYDSYESRADKLIGLLERIA